MGYDFGKMFYRLGQTAASLNPLAALAYNVLVPEPEYDINAELKKVRDQYAQMMRNELRRAAQYQANRSRAAMARRGVYAGSAYQPEYQRLMEQNQAYMQSALDKLAAENALRGYTWRQQQYLQEQAGREQMLQDAASQMYSLLGTALGYGVEKSNADYNRLLQQSLLYTNVKKPGGGNYTRDELQIAGMMIQNLENSKDDPEAYNSLKEYYKQLSPEIYYGFIEPYKKSSGKDYTDYDRRIMSSFLNEYNKITEPSAKYEAVYRFRQVYPDLYRYLVATKQIMKID